MRVLVTGSRGFIGKNLVVTLKELGQFEIVTFDRDDPLEALADRIAGVDAIVHLAGENRPADASQFEAGNRILTQALCDALRTCMRPVTLMIASSIQAESQSPYGISKRGAELAAEALATSTAHRVAIFRLPNVFGKWCKPNYNSVVATFCHNIANDLPIRIHDPSAVVSMVHVDAVIDAITGLLQHCPAGLTRPEVSPVYRMTLGDLAKQIERFRDCRSTLTMDAVGTGVLRALYATYVSYLPTSAFAYALPRHADNRGVFVEMLKTPDCGQFSFFTAHPGVTRGGHYHHTKTEKFLVIKGSARFGFRHILSGERFELVTDGSAPRIVETVPGWAHDITNIGEDEMVVMLWANEIFDPGHPDTFSMKVAT